jgi:hypothetical protein
MKTPTAQFAALAVVSFAASISVIVDHSPSKPDEPVECLSSGAERQALEVVLLRTTAKSRIARDVIAGRLSLLQAAALFGALNEVSPQSQSESYRCRFSQDTDEELLCRQVLGYVGCDLDEEPDRREAAMVRLEADFKEQRKNGAIRLSEVLGSTPVENLLAQARVELTERGLLSEPLRSRRAHTPIGEDGSGR